MLTRGHDKRPAVDLKWTLVAGILLGLHLWVWITSLYYTSVANSVLLVTTQPIWAAIIATVFLRERVPAWGWIGIALALSGSAATIGYQGVQLRGDLLAVLGGILAASYMVVGRQQRQGWEPLPYVAYVYATAAVTLAVVMVATGADFRPARSSDWWLFGLIALVPQGIGHSLYNVVLKHLPAYVVATSITGEPIGASLLALWWLGEAPPGRTLFLAPVVLMGIFIVGWSQRRRLNAK
jgi:drug/metabolite transporter (DMT)-like permease